MSAYESIISLSTETEIRKLKKTEKQDDLQEHGHVTTYFFRNVFPNRLFVGGLPGHKTI